MAIDTQTRAEVKHYRNYIGGEWVDAASGETFDVVNPATEETIATVPAGDREDARRAIAAARTAFDSGEWTGLEPEERKRILLSVVERVSAAEDELATLETMQAGMTIRATSTVVIGYCLQHWDYFARQATRPMQEQLEPVTYPTHSYNFVLREPIGVCAGIIPWNFPLVMAVWKLAPALAMGNTLCPEAGVQHAADGAAAGRDPRRDGPPEGRRERDHRRRVHGRRGARLAPGRRQDRVHRLDGGRAADHAARLQHDQEDDARAGRQVARTSCSTTPTWTQAVDGALWATFFHQGQVCESGTRLLLPESIHDEFVERLVERAKQIKVGDTMDYESDLGPLVSAQQRETVESYVRIGKEEGAKLVLGGDRPAGRRLRARLLVRADDLHRGRQLDDDRAGGDLRPGAVGDQVLRRRRRDPDRERLDLRARVGVWSTDPDRCLETAKRLQAGTVWINDYHLINCIAPFGGYKQSGIGRELGGYGLNEYTEVKHVHWDLGTPKEQKLFGVILSDSVSGASAEVREAVDFSRRRSRRAVHVAKPASAQQDANAI